MPGLGYTPLHIGSSGVYLFRRKYRVAYVVRGDYNAVERERDAFFQDDYDLCEGREPGAKREESVPGRF